MHSIRFRTRLHDSLLPERQSLSDAIATRSEFRVSGLELLWDWTCMASYQKIFSLGKVSSLYLFPDADSLLNGIISDTVATMRVHPGPHAHVGLTMESLVRPAGIWTHAAWSAVRTLTDSAIHNAKCICQLLCTHEMRAELVHCVVRVFIIALHWQTRITMVNGSLFLPRVLSAACECTKYWTKASWYARLQQSDSLF